SSLINFPLVAAPALTAFPLLTFFVKSASSRNQSTTNISTQKNGTEIRLQTRSSSVRPSIQSSTFSISDRFD
ncbi:hypothetical protein PFISCL1PPCAC_3349, partial [Pristionchus fissidentatus]